MVYNCKDAYGNGKLAFKMITYIYFLHFVIRVRKHFTEQSKKTLSAVHVKHVTEEYEEALCTREKPTKQSMKKKISDKESIWLVTTVVLSQSADHFVHELNKIKCIIINACNFSSLFFLCWHCSFLGLAKQNDLILQ